MTRAPDRTLIALGALLCVATVVVAALSGGGSSAAPSAAGSSSAASGAKAVTIKDYEYKPPTLTVKAGTKVTFTNEDKANHTATGNGGSFDSGTIGSGQKKVVTLKKPGSFTYVCSFHAFMKGTVVVK